MTPRRHEPPRLGHPGNIAGGGKTFSPPPALCSGPTRSRLSSSAARAALSLPAHRERGQGRPAAPLSARPARAPLPSSASKATAAALHDRFPRRPPRPGAEPRPLLGRPGVSALAPPAGARGSSSTALPTSAPENPSLSRRRTGSGPQEPARRRESTLLATGSGAAFPPHRPPPFWLSSPAAAQLPAGEGSHGGLCLPTVRGARPAQPSPGPPTARGLAAPRGAYRCSYRSPGSRAAAAAGPGRPPLLLPAPRCPRRGLARSAARTMGSGPR